MNQGRIWCVVNPTVGLPLFLGSVALMSFTVHFAVLNNSSWVKNFFDGVPLAKMSSIAPEVAPVAKLPAVKPALAIEVAEVTFTNDVKPFVLVPKAKSLGQSPG